MSEIDLIADDLRADDELLSAAVAEAPQVPEGAAARAASGPRAASDRSGYRYGLEAIREGQRLHSGPGLIVTTDDSDLALLAGDRLYAAGLERIARLGDGEAVAELSRLIRACASAMADGREDRIEAEWDLSASRIGGLGGD
jgi:hypothetical protein